MKKILSAAALLLALALLASCGVQQTLHQVAEELGRDREEVPASESEVFPAEEPEEEPEKAPDEEPAEASESDIGEPADRPAEEETTTDFLSLSAEDCLADRDDVTNGRLPRVTLDCEGAREINEDIEGRFGYLFGDEYARLNYEAYKHGNGRWLCVLAVMEFDDGSRFYTPYVLDVRNGEWIDGEELLSRLGVSEAELEEEELVILGEEFEHMYGSGLDLPEDMRPFLEEQRERTVDPSNAETDRVWLGDEGRLMFVGVIYSMAGAESYEYPVATQRAFP